VSVEPARWVRKKRLLAGSFSCGPGGGQVRWAAPAVYIAYAAVSLSGFTR